MLLRFATTMTSQDDDSLLERIRAGDREAAAAFLMRHGDLVRRRIRGRLGPALRSVFDSDEILSTLARRLDEYVSKSPPDVRSEADMLDLIVRIASNAIIDKARIADRLRKVHGQDAAFARQMLVQLESAGAQDGADSGFTLVIDKALEALSDNVDRKILWMWLRGWRLSEIARMIGAEPKPTRQRWGRIKKRLAPVLEPHND